MTLETVQQAMYDIEDFYLDERLLDEDVNTYVRIYDHTGKHLSSSYYTTLAIRGRNLHVRRGKYVNNEKNIGHQYNYEWVRKFHILDIKSIEVKFLYGDKSIYKVYRD